MENNIDDTAYGIAAFSILREVTLKMIERNHLSKADILAILDRVAKTESAHGFASDNSLEVEAARLVGAFAIAVRHLS